MGACTCQPAGNNKSYSDPVKAKNLSLAKNQPLGASGGDKKMEKPGVGQVFSEN